MVGGPLSQQGHCEEWRNIFLLTEIEAQRWLLYWLSYFSRILTAIFFVTVITAVIPVITFKEIVNTALFVGTSELV
jgi:Na+-transporting NADH:ubiquinone oxidoreductase subunit NqrB